MWQARKYLKGKNIYINEDFPKAIQDKRRILRPIMQKAKSLNMSAFLNVDTLIIEETKYTVDDIGKLPSELDPSKIATKEVGDNLLVFFGGQSLLSNFNKSDFVVNDVKYDCSERFYVRGKAEFAEDRDAIDAVMRAETPLDVKIISDNLNKRISVKAWMEKAAEKVMLKGVKAKFCQSPRHRDYLLSTRDKVLVEVNPREIHWSCGLATKDTARILDTANWPGKN